MLVVGDVHGEFRTLMKLLDQFPSEQICLVGDLIDRGPDSIAVVDHVIANSGRIKCVRGNHEQLCLDFFDNDDPEWLIVGGKAVHDAYMYDSPPEKLVRHLEFFRSLPHYLKFRDLVDEWGRYLVVSHSVIKHAEPEAAVADESILWGRWIPPEDPSGGRWFNCFGHTIVQEPIVTSWCAALETGCFAGGALTGLLWPQKQVVKAQRFDMEDERSSK